MARTSISNWTIGNVALGTENPGTPGNYPLGAGTTTVLTTPLSSNITADQLTIPVADTTGFPDPTDPNVADVKYIGIWNAAATVVQTDTGPVSIPAFEMVAYTNKTGTTFTVPAAGRGAFDTAQQPFAAGSLVYLGYDASDGLGDLVRHRHPMNVPLLNWQDAQYNPTFVAGDRALIIDPSDWQAFDPSIPYVDIPLDHDAGYPPVDPLSEQLSQDYEIADWIECLTCHRAHGSDATMDGFAGATLLPATVEGFNTLLPGAPGSDDGVPPTGDSALLRADNRGVCERCHNK
jgi:hypothetical protein